MKSLGSLVKELIEQKGLSPKSVSDASGIHQSVMYRLLKDESDPQIGTLAKIADILGVSRAYLIATPEEREKLKARPEPEPEADPILARLEALEAKLANPTPAPTLPRRPARHPLLALAEGLSPADADVALKILQGYFAKPRPHPKKKSG